MENITRISDLPEQNNVYNPNIQNPQMYQIDSRDKLPLSGDTSNYVPINIHPNPYGISEQNPIMPYPQQPNLQQQPNIPQQPNLQQSNLHYDEQLQQMQRQRLPSRDIPQDQSYHIHDEEVKPNYIPKVRFANDFVRNHEDMTNKNLRDYEEKNKREHKFDIFINEIQTPIFITILFFFFQLPIINLFFKRFSFLSIYNLDGNFNFYGLIFKSIIFGSLYYTAMKSIRFLSEF
jgi:hypothetical protein